MWFLLADLGVTVVRHALVAVCARVTNAFVAFTHDLVCAVALGAARCRVVRAIRILLARLVAIEEVTAHHVHAAARHALEAESAHVTMLLAAMEAD